MEFSADMVILKPVDMAKGASTLFFEVNNRGRKISFGRMHDTASDANMNDPMARAGFRQRLPDEARLRACLGRLGRGHRAGRQPPDGGFPDRAGEWQADQPNASSPSSPTAISMAASPRRCRCPAVTAFKSFPAVSTDKKEAEAELYVIASDSPRPSGPDIPSGEPVADDEWAFADCPDGWPGTPSVEPHLPEERLSQRPQLPPAVPRHRLAGDGPWLRHRRATSSRS